MRARAPRNIQPEVACTGAAGVDGCCSRRHWRCFARSIAQDKVHDWEGATAGRDLHVQGPKMSDVVIEDGSDGSDEEGMDLMDFIETDRNLDEEKQFIDPEVCYAPTVALQFATDTTSYFFYSRIPSLWVLTRDCVRSQVQALHDAIEEVTLHGTLVASPASSGSDESKHFSIAKRRRDARRQPSSCWPIPHLLRGVPRRA
jgi:hypothetical protein